MKFTPEAKEIYIREADSLREEMERPGFPYHLKGPWSKMEAYLARLSLILALARIAEAESALDFFEMVTEQDVEAAAQLVAYFKAHARRVYAELHGEKPENLLAEALKVFLGEQGGPDLEALRGLEGPLDTGAAWRRGTVRQADQEDCSARPPLRSERRLAGQRRNDKTYPFYPRYPR